MEIDSLVNVLLSMGIPGVILVIVIYLTKTYVPKALDTYKNVKESEQKAFSDRQKDYKEQSDKIVEVATASKVAIEYATNALSHNSEVNSAVVNSLSEMQKAFSALSENIKAHDKRAEDMNVDIKKILENARRAGS